MVGVCWKLLVSYSFFRCDLTVALLMLFIHRLKSFFSYTITMTNFTLIICSTKILVCSISLQYLAAERYFRYIFTNQNQYLTISTISSTTLRQLISPNNHPQCQTIRNLLKPRTQQSFDYDSPRPLCRNMFAQTSSDQLLPTSLQTPRQTVQPARVERVPRGCMVAAQCRRCACATRCDFFNV